MNKALELLEQIEEIEENKYHHARTIVFNKEDMEGLERMLLSNNIEDVTLGAAIWENNIQNMEDFNRRRLWDRLYDSENWEYFLGTSVNILSKIDGETILCKFY